MGKKHTDKSKKKMSKSRKKYFERIDIDEYRKYHIGKKQSNACKKKHSILSKKMWSDKEWATEMRRKLSESIRRPDVRKKISKALKGKPKSKSHIRKVSDALKKKWQDPEYKAKMLKANNTKKMKRIRSKNSRGKNNASWCGGISKLPYAFGFDNKLKEKIRKRDNYTCQLSGKTEKELGEKLISHHIDYDKMNCKENNLISLSRSSNSKVNFNRKFWAKKFRRLIFDKYNH